MKKRPRKIEAAGIDGSYLNGVAVSIQRIKKYIKYYLIYYLKNSMLQWSN